MDSVYLLSLSARQADWLAHRQALVAENVANVNTPGYGAKDLTAFSEILDDTAMTLEATNPMHLAGLNDEGPRAGGETTRAETWDVKHSGNTVAVEEEMMKAGEIARDFSLNTSIVKSFHRMYMSAVRG